MSAPTPVRALVHSRTLVTAGLILLINFYFFLLGVFFVLIFSLFGGFTILFSSICALLEKDLKKVVALRTLSQIGLSTIILGFGLFFFCLFHLFSHALFKSCLFIQVGFFIYRIIGQQDGRFYSFGFFYNFILQINLLVTLFCLCGLFFFSGIVSKDFFLEFGFRLSLNFFFLLFFFFVFF